MCHATHCTACPDARRSPSHTHSCHCWERSHQQTSTAERFCKCPHLHCKTTPFHVCTRCSHKCRSTRFRANRQHRYMPKFAYLCRTVHEFQERSPGKTWTSLSHYTAPARTTHTCFVRVFPGRTQPGSRSILRWARRGRTWDLSRSGRY